MRCSIIRSLLNPYTILYKRKCAETDGVKCLPLCNLELTSVTVNCTLGVKERSVDSGTGSHAGRWALSIIDFGSLATSTKCE